MDKSSKDIKLQMRNSYNLLNIDFVFIIYNSKITENKSLGTVQSL